MYANPKMLGFWEKYRNEFEYAKNIEFADACDTVLRIMESIRFLYD